MESHGFGDPAYVQQIKKIPVKFAGVHRQSNKKGRGIKPHPSIAWAKGQ